MTIASSGETPYADLTAALATIAARDQFIGDFDWRSAVKLMPLYRMTNTSISDSDVIAEGRQLVEAAEAEFAERSAISWRSLLDLQARRRPGSFTEQVAAATAAARILRSAWSPSERLCGAAARHLRGEVRGRGELAEVVGGGGHGR